METRRISQPVELRDGDNGKMATGYAAIFHREGDDSTEFTLWDGQTERIMPGAFDRALSESHDVRALVNHDPNQLLGRTAAGTLRLSVDSVGLRYEIDIADTQAGRDAVTSLERGDLSGSSFAFSIPENGQKFTDGYRSILDVNLFDVGPVAYPAYSGTEAGVRAEHVAEARSAFDAHQETAAALRQMDAEDRERRIRLLTIDD